MRGLKKISSAIIIIMMILVHIPHILATTNVTFSGEVYDDNVIVITANILSDAYIGEYLTVTVKNADDKFICVKQSDKINSDKAQVAIKIADIYSYDEVFFNGALGNEKFSEKDIVFSEIHTHNDYSSVYVSPIGSDTEDGSKLMPVKTINRAIEIAKENKFDTVYLRGGYYQLWETLSFCSDMTFKAYEDEEPIFYGGEYIRGNDPGFKKVMCDELEKIGIGMSYFGKVMKFDLKTIGISQDMLDYSIPEWKTGNLSGEIKRMMVSVDDTKYHLARYPNKIANEDYAENPYDTYLEIGNILNDGKGNEKAEFISNYTGITKWKSLDNIIITGATGYSYNTVSSRVDIVENSRRVKLKAFGNQNFLLSGGRYYFENVLDELDAENEYYITPDGVLYIYTGEGFENKTVKITTFDEDYIADLTNVSNVVLEGITFDMSMGSGLIASGGENITIKNCNIKNVSLKGVVFGNEGFSNTNFKWYDFSKESTYKELKNKDEKIIKNGKNYVIDGCLILNTGNKACDLKGGSMISLTGADFTIKNSVIKYSGMFTSGYNSGIGLNGCGFTIKNNDIYFARGQAIIGNFNMSNIVYNDIGNCCSDMLEDTGVIYCNYGGSNLDVKIRYNYIHDVPFLDSRTGKSFGYPHRTAFYYDNVDFYEETNFNVVANVPSVSAGLREVDNYVTNNIIIDCISAFEDTTNAFDELKDKDFSWVSSRYGDYPGNYYENMPTASDNEMFDKWREKYSYFYEALEHYRNKTDYTQTMQKMYDNVVVNISRDRVGKPIDESVKTDSWGMIENNQYANYDIGFSDYSQKIYQLSKETSETLGIEWIDLSKVGASAKVSEEIGLEHINEGIAYSGISQVLYFNEGVGISKVYLNDREIYENSYKLNYRKIDNVQEQKNRLLLDKSLFSEAGTYNVKVESYYGQAEEIQIMVSPIEIVPYDIEVAADIAFKNGSYYKDTYVNFPDFIKESLDEKTVVDAVKKSCESYGYDYEAIADLERICAQLMDSNHKSFEDFWAKLTEFINSITYEMKPNDVSNESYRDMEFIFDTGEKLSGAGVYIDSVLLDEADYVLEDAKLTVNANVFDCIKNYKVVLNLKEKRYISEVSIDKFNADFLESNLDEWEKAYVPGSIQNPDLPEAKTILETLVSEVKDQKSIMLYTVDEFLQLNGSKAGLAFSKKISEEYVCDDVVTLCFSVENLNDTESEISVYLGSRLIMSVSQNRIKSSWPYYTVCSGLEYTTYENKVDFKVQYNMIDKTQRIWYKVADSQWKEICYERTDNVEGYSTDYITLNNTPVFNKLAIVKNAVGQSIVSDISFYSEINSLIKKIDKLDTLDKEAVDNLMAEYVETVKHFSQETKDKITNSQKLIRAYNNVWFTDCTIDGTTYTVGVQNGVENAIYACAVYENKRLLEIKRGYYSDIIENRLTFKCETQGDEIRFLVWDSLDLMKPMGKVKTIITKNGGN